MADTSVTIQLSRPVQDGAQQLTSLTLRRPKAIDLDVMDEARGSRAGTRRLAARLAAVGQSAIDDLDCYDFGQVAEAISNFLEKPATPASGATV
jgi:hypothetical protein